MSSSEETGLKGLWKQLSQNRFGFVGFGLSLLQLIVHGSWLTFATVLTANGKSEQLPPGSWQLWVIAILIIIGGLLTMVSLFVCLYGSIHGKPKILAYLGLAISFFIGALTSCVLLINALG